MTDKNNKIPFNEDNYTHNINRNNERKLDRRGFMKTLSGSGRSIRCFLPSLGSGGGKRINGAWEIKNIHTKKLPM